jgi:glycosyltransferase involved in cell wall biosynthesis
MTITWGTFPLSPWDGWLEDSRATLYGFPLDRLNWPHQNSHRLDIVPLGLAQSKDLYEAGRGRRGHRVNGKVLPVENRHFNHWNTDPWRLDYSGDGRELADADLFVLPRIVDPVGASDILPTVITEAMACRLPVISTTVTAGCALVSGECFTIAFCGIPIDDQVPSRESVAAGPRWAALPRRVRSSGPSRL